MSFDLSFFFCNFIYIFFRYGNRDNIAFYGSEVDAAVLFDIQLFKSAEGGTIVENTSHGIQRKIKLMETISQQTGVNILAGTGMFYLTSKSEVGIL